MRTWRRKFVNWKVKSIRNISLQLPRPYRFLARQTDTSFTKVPLHRLFHSKTNHAPLSLSPIVKETSNTVDLSDKIIVSGGTITDDIHLTEVLELTINAAKIASSTPAVSEKTTRRQANTWTRKETLHNIEGTRV
ncbi:hypothetical protein DFH08DRAFT_874552 [Mycena albidolilacea]|uniref:Large ribosomal subunit protein uL15/eL18 domain-containing protein n=1 Tax=Mycena albidolilacea TaxID=1033008 RepID=A0AAD6ZVV0_9AGAR|nr:hypothetical protein DFH08DRAFT_874552 [Mycena albidolilacea]